MLNSEFLLLDLEKFPLKLDDHLLKLTLKPLWGCGEIIHKTLIMINITSIKMTHSGIYLAHCGSRRTKLRISVIAFSMLVIRACSASIFSSVLMLLVMLIHSSLRVSSVKLTMRSEA